MERNQIITGDARVLSEEISDESIDFIFTDPVYDNLDDYRWLGEIAMRVLRPDSSMLVWASKIKMFAAREAVLESGLRYALHFDYTIPGKSARLIGYNIFIWTTPCLWFHKGGGKLKNRISDTVIDIALPHGKYKWNKNLAVIKKWMGVFTEVGDVIFDPFAGSGSVEVVAKETGRNFVAFEIDKEVAEQARERLGQISEVRLGELSIF